VSNCENRAKNEMMENLLIDISEKAIKSEDFNFTSEQIENNWLGNIPASEKQIFEAENKLGVKFPEDYKEFLRITNGFSAPNDVEPSFEEIEKIDYLKNIDESIIETYNLVELEHAIIVGGISEEQYFLLLPPKTENEKWKYWKFANWIPGEEQYSNLKDYFREVLNFITEINEDK
jgi:cell wall assembly regulator SMI1